MSIFITFFKTYLKYITPLFIILASHPISASVQQQIGSLDTTRAGNFSFVNGQYFDQARASLVSNFSEVTLTSTTNITPEFLETVNVFILGAANSCCTAITPLTVLEQQALVDFVVGGGSLIVHADNDLFHHTAAAVNESFLAPFGLAATGTLHGHVSSTVQNPSSSPITSGDFGVINYLIEIFPGAFSELGNAIPLASNDLGPSLAVLDAGSALPTGEVIRGKAVFFSESTLFVDNNIWFVNSTDIPHLELLSNLIDFALTPPIIKIQIDIKPSSHTNNININTSSVIPVALLSTNDFNTTTDIDLSTISIAGANVKLLGNGGTHLCNNEDVNTDGLMDIVCLIETSQVMIELGQSLAALEAKTHEGILVHGEDFINIFQTSLGH